MEDRLMYRPFRIFLGFPLLILAADSALLSYLVSYGYGVGVLVLLPAVAWCWSPVKDELPEDENGWELGEGVDLEHPKKQRRTHVVLQDKVLNLGLLGLGAPGSGKTVSLALGLIYYLSVLFHKRTEQRLGWGYIEGKGDKEIYQWSVASGAAPDYFFSSELPSTHTMNLFHGKPEDVVDRWSRILVPSTSSTSFYSDEQKRVLQITIPLIKALGEAKQVPVNLRDLYVLLTHPDAPIKVLDEARSLELPGQMVAMAEKYFAEEYSERQQLLKGMTNRLFMFVNGPEADRINAYNPNIVLEDIVRDGQRVYFHMPLTEYSKDLVFAIFETFGAIARDRQNFDSVRQRWHLIGDDVGGFFYDGIAKITARARSAGVPIHLLFQSKAQMDEIDPTFADQIDDTVSTKVFLRIMGERTRDWASRMMGTYEDIKYSVSDRSDNALDGSSLGTMKDARVEPQEFAQLHDGEAIVSTTFKLEKGLIRSRRVRVRFPLPPTESDPADVDWPKCNPLPEVEGLGLWDHYMTIQSSKKPRAESSDSEDGPNAPQQNPDDYSDDIEKELFS